MWAIFCCSGLAFVSVCIYFYIMIYKKHGVFKKKKKNEGYGLIVCSSAKIKISSIERQGQDNEYITGKADPVQEVGSTETENNTEALLSPSPLVCGNR